MGDWRCVYFRFTISRRFTTLMFLMSVPAVSFYPVTFHVYVRPPSVCLCPSHFVLSFTTTKPYKNTRKRHETPQRNSFASIFVLLTLPRTLGSSSSLPFPAAAFLYMIRHPSRSLLSPRPHSKRTPSLPALPLALRLSCRYIVYRLGYSQSYRGGLTLSLYMEKSRLCCIVTVCMCERL